MRCKQRSGKEGKNPELEPEQGKFVGFGRLFADGQFLLSVGRVGGKMERPRFGTRGRRDTISFYLVTGIVGFFSRGGGKEGGGLTCGWRGKRIVLNACRGSHRTWTLEGLSW